MDHKERSEEMKEARERRNEAALEKRRQLAKLKEQPEGKRLLGGRRPRVHIN